MKHILSAVVAAFLFFNFSKAETSTTHADFDSVIKKSERESKKKRRRQGRAIADEEAELQAALKKLFNPPTIQFPDFLWKRMTVKKH